MKLKFKDGTIVEVTDTEGKSKEEIIAEAKKVYKEFKDSQNCANGECVEDTKENVEIKDVNPEEINKLIKEDEDAVRSYENAIKIARESNDEAAVARYQHIIEEEMEHIQELKDLLANDVHDSKPISDAIDAEFVAEVNKEIGGRPFEFTEEEDGFADVLYVELDNTGKLVAGTATNAGIVADYGIPYDINVSLDENLNNLYETIIETRNNEASIQDEEEVIEEEIEEV